ncbi:MAG: hypothetical protein ACFFDN_37160 [Candidatus Hodarchaeota archaeon]
MKRSILIFSLTVALISSVLLTLPVQPVAAIGPVFEDTSGTGFTFKEGDSWTLELTDITLPIPFTIPFLPPNTTIGDKIRLTVTKTNNSNGSIVGFGMLPLPYDTVFGIMEYYNSSITNKSWGVVMPETCFGAYNQSIPFPYTGVSLFAHSRNLTVNNASINTLIGSQLMSWILPGSYNQNDPAPKYYGTWELWNGTSTTANSFRTIISTNSKGQWTLFQIYESGISDWELILELKLVEKEEDLTGLLLLAMMAGGGGGLGTEIIILIGVAAAIGVIIVIIAIKKAKG